MDEVLALALESPLPAPVPAEAEVLAAVPPPADVTSRAGGAAVKKFRVKPLIETKWPGSPCIGPHRASIRSLCRLAAC